MRLHLDWDSDALKEMHLPAVREQQPVEENQRRLQEFSDAEPEADKWELWKSSGHGNGDSNGWHYVEYGLDGGLEDNRRLRQAYGDDKLRISLDGKRMEWGSPFVGVLYHMKNIKPHEHKPYETANRAELVERHGFEESDAAQTLDPETGRIQYDVLAQALADHEDFGSRADLWRRIKQRGSVEVTTRASARAYDIVHGRREPTTAEKKALRDYGMSREIGHYGGGMDSTPEELAEKPSRLTFHEYWEMPEFDLNTQNFGEEDTDSDWYPANFRTGTYDGVDEMTVKQVHDRIVDKVREMLSPSAEVEHDLDEGGTKTVTHGFENPVARYNRMISLERDRPLDRDEYAHYRKIWHRNQPQLSEEQVHERTDRHDIDQFGDDAVHWEVIIYEGEDALKGNGPTSYWWIARGVLDASDPDAVRNPVRNSAIVADTMNFL